MSNENEITRPGGHKIVIEHKLVYKTTTTTACYDGMTMSEAYQMEVNKDTDEIFFDVVEDESSCKVTQTTIKLVDEHGNTVDEQTIDHEE